MTGMSVVKTNIQVIARDDVAVQIPDQSGTIGTLIRWVQ
jgi:hypothetical protein